MRNTACSLLHSQPLYALPPSLTLFPAWFTLLVFQNPTFTLLSLSSLRGNPAQRISLLPLSTSFLCAYFCHFSVVLHYIVIFLLMSLCYGTLLGQRTWLINIYTPKIIILILFLGHAKLSLEPGPLHLLFSLLEYCSSRCSLAFLSQVTADVTPSKGPSLISN